MGMFCLKTDNNKTCWSETIPTWDISMIWQIGYGKLACFFFWKLQQAALQQQDRAEIHWMLGPLFWDKFWIDNYSETKMSDQLLWWCILKLKFNRQLLVWRGCSFRLDLILFIFKFGHFQNSCSCPARRVKQAQGHPVNGFAWLGP